MSTPTPVSLESGLHNEYIRKQLMQAVYAADYTAPAIASPVGADGTLAAIPA